MKVSLSWLQNYLSVDILLEGLVDSLTMRGLEVESVVDRFDYLNSVFVGRIESIKPHPVVSKLSLCIVDCGQKSITVICGATNVVVGMLVPVALCGTIMPSGKVIGKRDIKGITSNAFLCSELDLGLGIFNGGLMSLDKIGSVGQRLRDVFSFSDSVIDISLTPNRPDCSSIIGVAREVAAIKNAELKRPFSKKIEIDNNISVNVACPDKCLQYMAIVFENIEIMPSPFWLQDRLLSVGLMPMNNIVDITNFVLLETGQPLHVYDFDLLDGSGLIIDTVKRDINFTTLDGINRILSENMVSIFSGDRPIAIAGVMGGLHSSLTRETKRVLIESAYFNPESIRETAKKLGILTEASYRFERGVDPKGIMKALDRTVDLILELTSARVIGGNVDKSSICLVPDLVIDLDVDVVNCFLGVNLTLDQISELLSSIDFLVEVVSKKKLRIKVPSFRVDIKQSEDLMEEIARLYGYDNIPLTFPKTSISCSELGMKLEQINKIKFVLSGIGFSEIINYSFVDIDSCNLLKIPVDDNRRKQVGIINPISNSQSNMRSFLLPAILDTVHRNISRQIKDLMVFEIGKVFFSNGSNCLPDEVDMLMAIYTGSRVKSSWCNEEKQCDFFDIKGLLEEFLEIFKINNPSFIKKLDESCLYFRKGHAAKVFASDVCLGSVGELDTKVLSNYSIKQKVFMFEINIVRFLELIPTFNFVKPIPKFPVVSRDATIILNENIEVGKLFSKIKNLNEELIDSFYLLDVFKNTEIRPGMKSVSFRIIYRSFRKTLDDEAVNFLHKSIVERLVSQFKASLPSL